MSDNRRRIIKDSSRYLTASIFSQVAGLIRTLAVTIILTPAQLGLWNFMNVLVGYGANAHLGLLHGMNKLVPALHANKEIGRLEAVKDSVFWFNVLLGAIASFIAFAASYLVSGIYAGELRIVSAIIFAQMFFTYLFCLLRAESRFALVSSGIAVFAALSTILVLFFAYIYPNPLRGALWGLLAANILAVGYWVLAAGYKFAYSVKMEEVRASFRLGVPLIVLGLIDMCFLSIDRWVIATKLGPEALGYYAIAIMAVNILGLAAVSLSNVLFPHMVEKFAEKRNTAGTENLLLVPLNAVVAAMTLFVFMAYIILPLLIKLFLPKYIASIPLVNILLPAAFFLSLAAIAGTYIIAINKQAALIKIQITAALVAFLLDCLFVALGYGVIGVAYGTLVGYIVSGAGYAGSAVYFVTRSKYGTSLFMGKICAPVLLMPLAFYGADNLLLGMGPVGPLEAAGVRVAIIGVPLLFVLWLSHRNGKLAGVIASECKRFLSARGLFPVR